MSARTPGTPQSDVVQVKLLASVFKDERPYFVAVQLGDSPKDRTEVSAATDRPDFAKSTFEVPLRGALFPGTALKLHLGAFVVLSHAKGQEGKASLLGVGAYRLRNCVARLQAGEAVVADVILRADPKKFDEPPVGKITVELRFARGGRRRSAVAGSHAGTSVGRCSVLVRSAMNLPLVGPDDDLACSRVECWLDYEKGDEAEAESKGGGTEKVVFTNVIPDERNPRWDRKMDLNMREGDCHPHQSRPGNRGVLALNVVDVGHPGDPHGVPQRDRSVILRVRIPLNLFVFGHCYNLRLHWAEQGSAALFVTVVMASPAAVDEREADGVDRMERVQLTVHGVSGSLSPAWLDLPMKRGAAGGDDVSEVDVRALHSAELVVSGSLLGQHALSELEKVMTDGKILGAANAEALASARRAKESPRRPTSGGSDKSGDSRPGSSKSRPGSAGRTLTGKKGSFMIGPRGIAAPEEASIDVGASGLDMSLLTSLPLLAADVDEDGSIDFSLLEEDLADHSIVRSLTQLTGPAMPPPLKPQWNESMEFTLGGPSRHPGVPSFPDSLAVDGNVKAAVLLTMFRRDVPPVSKAQAPGIRRHSINREGGQPPLPHPSLRVGRALVRLPPGLPLNGDPVELTDVEVEDLTSLTIIREGSERSMSKASASDDEAEPPRLRVTVRAWSGPAFASSRLMAQSNEQKTSAEALKDAAEAERSEEVGNSRVKTPELAGAPAEWDDDGDAADEGTGETKGEESAKGMESTADNAMDTHWDSLSRAGPAAGRPDSRASEVSELTGKSEEMPIHPIPQDEPARQLSARSSRPGSADERPPTHRSAPSSARRSEGGAASRPGSAGSVRRRLEISEAQLRDQVERLKSEVDRRSEAIRSCGVEIVRLRKAVKTGAATNRRLSETLETERKRRELEDAEVSEDALGHAIRNVDLNDHAAVVRRMQLLAKKYIAERRNTLELTTQLESMKAEGDSAEELQKRYDKLLSAHTKQNKFLQSMQDDVRQTTVLKETIKTQEKVIAKLEEVLEERLAERMNRPTRPPRGAWREARSTAGDETARTESEAGSEEAEDEPVEESPQFEGEDTSGWIDPMWGGGPQMKCTKRAWSAVNSKLIARETRLDVLEQELTDNAGDFGNTMAELKMKILEFEMGAGGDDDFDDDGSDISSLKSGDDEFEGHSEF